MSENTLSRNDVENLLKSLDETASSSTAPTPASSVKLEGKKGSPKIRVLNYDFKRPERVGKEQMRSLQSLHDGFARNFGASLSAMLRSIIEVRLISVDQLTYSEFVYSLEIPTCFNLLKPLPLEGNWVLDISPSLLYPIIDRMLGGSVSSEAIPKRPLSEIELRLAARITTVFLKELQDAWRNVLEMDLRVERVESNPQLVQIVPPNEVVVMVSFELVMGAIRGTINLCIPFNTIERVGSKLSSNSWIGYATARTNEQSVKQISSRLDGSIADMVVTLARSSITTAELFGLEVGDIISTEKDIHHPLEVEIASRVKFLASAGSYKGRKAIKIEQVMGKS
jgi:flagellar motor switch protein FliM